MHALYAYMNQTHIHTYTHTHTHTHTHTNTHIGCQCVWHIYARAHTHGTRRHTDTHEEREAHTHTHTHTQIYTQIHAHKYTHKYTHTNTLTHQKLGVLWIWEPRKKEKYQCSALSVKKNHRITVYFKHFDSKNLSARFFSYNCLALIRRLKMWLEDVCVCVCVLCIYACTCLRVCVFKYYPAIYNAALQNCFQRGHIYSNRDRTYVYS
jgi:hypothetical protein